MCLGAAWDPLPLQPFPCKKSQGKHFPVSCKWGRCQYPQPWVPTSPAKGKTSASIKSGAQVSGESCSNPGVKCSSNLSFMQLFWNNPAPPCTESMDNWNTEYTRHSYFCSMSENNVVKRLNVLDNSNVFLAVYLAMQVWCHESTKTEAQNGTTAPSLAKAARDTRPLGWKAAVSCLSREIDILLLQWVP